jgi:hypothetical protein
MTSRIWLALSMAAMIALGATRAAAETDRFDGSWSVVVLTEKGSCSPSYQFPILIEEGRARYGGPGGVAVSGSVAANGAVRGSIGTSGASVNVAGRLSGASGGGTWTAGGALTCSGRWQAEKRG